MTYFLIFHLKLLSGNQFTINILTNFYDVFSSQHPAQSPSEHKCTKIDSAFGATDKSGEDELATFFFFFNAKSILSCTIKVKLTSLS